MTPPLDRFKPAVSRQTTLFVAAVLWAVAGWKALDLGIEMVVEPGGHPWAGGAAGLLGFPLFFGLVFRRVTRRYSLRLVRNAVERPCVFSVFDRRGWALMAFMITLGVLARTLALVPHTVLGPFYLALGLSLLASALLFARGGWRYAVLRRDVAGEG